MYVCICICICISIYIYPLLISKPATMTQSEKFVKIAPTNNVLISKHVFHLCDKGNSAN